MDRQSEDILKMRTLLEPGCKFVFPKHKNELSELNYKVILLTKELYTKEPELQILSGLVENVTWLQNSEKFIRKCPSRRWTLGIILRVLKYLRWKLL